MPSSASLRAGTIRLFGACLALGLLLTPTVVRACAACMNDNPNRQKTIPILMGFIGFPFLVVGGVLWAIRRASSGEDAVPSRSPEERGHAPLP